MLLLMQSQSSCQCYKIADEINTVARVNKAGITGQLDLFTI